MKTDVFIVSKHERLWVGCTLRLKNKDQAKSFCKKLNRKILDSNKLSAESIARYIFDYHLELAELDNRFNMSKGILNDIGILEKNF